MVRLTCPSTCFVLSGARRFGRARKHISEGQKSRETHITRVGTSTAAYSSKHICQPAPAMTGSRASRSRKERSLRRARRSCRRAASSARIEPSRPRRTTLRPPPLRYSPSGGNSRHRTPTWNQGLPSFYVARGKEKACKRFEACGHVWFVLAATSESLLCLKPGGYAVPPHRRRSRVCSGGVNPTIEPVLSSSA